MNEPECYCGSQKNYKDCCQLFLAGLSKPQTPEQLMRSRYTAFCIKDIEYLLSTQHPPSRQANEGKPLTKTMHDTQWLGLKILKTETDPDDPHTGYVEFAAFYKTSEIGQLHERSKFIHEAGNWYYLDGEYMDPLYSAAMSPAGVAATKNIRNAMDDDA